MSVKHKIVNDAISLFNERGISSVTMKQLSDYIGISPGNLTYHFKTKADLIETIYKRMHNEAEGFLLTKGHITLNNFDEAMSNYYQFNQRYKFFFNDVVFISTQFPAVAKMYEESNLDRFKQGRILIDYYVKSGRMVPESNYINYDKLIFNVWLTMAFWTAQTSIINDATYVVNKSSPVDMVWQQMFPYLTEKGWEEFNEIKTFSNTEISTNNNLNYQ